MRRPTADVFCGRPPRHLHGVPKMAQIVFVRTSSNVQQI